MKKLLLIFVLAAYSVAAMGINLNYFYCCNKLKSITFSGPKEERDCNHKKIAKKGCCDNKTVTIKLKADQKISENINVHLVAPLSPVILHSDNYTALNIAHYGNINPLYKRPPPNLLPSRQALYCVFRI